MERHEIGTKQKYLAACPRDIYKKTLRINLTFVSLFFPEKNLKQLRFG